MTEILAFAGEKQSGKSSSGNYIVGHILDTLEILPKIDDKPAFGMAEEDGLLQVCVDGKWVVLDLFDFNTGFDLSIIWPHVKIYNLADTLKEVAISVFGIDRRLCYGSDDDKNTETTITWDDMRFILAPRVVSRLKNDNMLKDNITIRQFLQLFGSDVCRRIKDDCWVKSCLDRIENEQSKLAIICDCRFRNEVDLIKSAGGKVIHLKKTRANKDAHISENDLVEYGPEKFDAVIDNNDMTLQEKNYKVLDLLYAWNILPLYKESDVTDPT